MELSKPPLPQMSWKEFDGQYSLFFLENVIQKKRYQRVNKEKRIGF